jgi:hypothetical protein
MAKSYKDPDGICVICGIQGIEYHHLLSRGSKGAIDEEWNLLPVDRICHTKIHSMGLNRMVTAHPRLRKWLVAHGWEYDIFNFKWRHGNAEKTK